MNKDIVFYAILVAISAYVLAELILAAVKAW